MATVIVKAVSQVLCFIAGAAMLACSANDTSPRSPAGTGGTNGQSGSTGSAGAGGAAGSGTGAGGGAAGSGAAGSISVNPGNGMDLNCGHKEFEVHPKPAEILIVLDRSASMLDAPDGSTTGVAKWDLVVPAVNQVVTDTNVAVSWGLKTFPEGAGSECVAGSVTPRIDVSIAPMNATAVTGAVTLTTPRGNGTPTGDAVNSAVNYLKTLTDNNPKYILLATDGEPSCPMPSTTARPFAVQAVTSAAMAGFHTFVLGVATTSNTANMTLTQLATAGLEERNDPNPLATRYYLANTKDEIVNSLKAITGVVASCAFDLGSAPPVPSNIAVKVAGMKAPQDPTNGWSYTGPDNTSLQVYGTWCDSIKASPDAVQIIFGCPGEVIN